MLVSAQTYGSRTSAAPGRHGKYQLDVTAHDVADVVRHAGGWLIDRAMAGWDIRVCVASDCDLTPLRILGVRTSPVDGDDDPTAPPRVLALAVSMDALAATGDVRDAVTRTLRKGRGEVTLWGADHQRSDLEPVEHVLSAAARAFKAQALRAAGLDCAVSAVETFHRRPTALLVD